MLISNSKMALARAAYCAIFMALMGCAGTKSSISNAAINDTLNAAKVRERADAIPNLSSAQAIEQNALARQAAADASIVNIDIACAPKFLVNKCIDLARQNRNDAWDAAQVELTAARLYLRRAQAEQYRIELQTKQDQYAAQEKANIPVRAANKAAFIAKQAASAKRQADYAAQQAAQAPKRAANVSTYEETRLKIEALKKKRDDDNNKRKAEAAAKK